MEIGIEDKVLFLIIKNQKNYRINILKSGEGSETF